MNTANPPPDLRTATDPESACRAAAEEFARRAGEAMGARGRFLVALTGGSTPRQMYQFLAADPLRGQVDWGRVHVFWGDERCVPPDHADSNYRMAHEALLAEVPVPDGQVHRMEAERADQDDAAREYQTVLMRAFAGAGPPVLDLVLLGMGDDGHVASLFPHTDGLKETERWVIVNHVPKLDADRMTLTYPVLNAAREVLFLVTGEKKAEALREVLQGPDDPERLPAQRVRPVGPKVWFVDEAAAAGLTKT